MTKTLLIFSEQATYKFKAIDYLFKQYVTQSSDKIEALRQSPGVCCNII